MLTLPAYLKTNVYITHTIIMYYPIIYGLKDGNVQKKINYEIKTQMYRLISELRRPDLVTYISGSYEIKTNERNVLSLILYGLGDFRGAHPITIVKALTVDISTGGVYELNELFKEDSNYEEVISDIISDEIKEREIAILGDFQGIKPNQDYYIADKAIVVFFQQYEISPYYVGFPYFVIPIYDIQDLIPEDGLLNRFTSFL